MYGALIPEEMINQDIKDSKAYKKEEPAKKPKRAKKPTKKYITVPTAGVVIRDTPGVFVSKKKAPTKVDKGKGMDLLYEVALLKAAQLKKTLNKSNDDVSNDDDDDDDDDSDAGGDNEVKEYKVEHVRTPNNYEFTNDDKEYEELYKDVNVRLKDTKHEKEGKGDAEMTDVSDADVSQEKSYEQVEDDAHVTLTASLDNEVVSMMNVKVHHEEPSIQTPYFLAIPVTSTPTLAPTTKTNITLIPVLLDFSSLFRFDQRVFFLERDLSQLKQVDYSAQLLKTTKLQIHVMVDDQLRTRLEDSIQKAFWSYTTKFEKKDQGEKKRYINLIEKSVKDIIKNEVKSQLPYILQKKLSDYATPKNNKDEDPPARSDQVLKRRKTRKDDEPSKGSKSKESKYSSSKGTKSQPKSTGKFVQADKSVFETIDIEMPQNQRITHVKLMKWYDYRYLEEIVVRREDHKLYKFKEGDFPRRNLHDIKDMLLLLVQKKICDLERDVIFDLNVAWRMFTRRVVILKRVEDLQLRVGTYQKKLNITKPETFWFDISKRTPYTANLNPQGIIYVDEFKRNRMDYLPKRRWINLGKERNGDDGPPPNGGGDLPVPDLRTMEELCQPTLNGRGGSIAPIAIQATNFRLKSDMIQQVQNSCQFHGLPGDDANKHLDKFLHVTQSIKVNGVTDDALRLYLFPHSLTHHATAWFDRLPRNSITTFEQMAKMFLGKYFPPSMVTKLRNEITNFRQHTFYNGLTLRHRDTINVAASGTFMKRRPEECYDLIENMTSHHTDWDTSVQRSESSSSITSSFDLEIVALKSEMTKINKKLMKVLQINQQVKAVTHSCETYGGPHSCNDCPATVGQTKNANDAILKNMQTNMTSLTNSNLKLKNMFGQFIKMKTASSSGSRTLPSNTITNPKEDLKGITTRSGIAYKGPTIPTTSSPPKVVEYEIKVTKDTVPPTNNGSTKDVQPPVVQVETQIPNSEPVVAPIIEPIVETVEALARALKPNPKPSIPYPSRLHDQKLCDKTNDQKVKFFQIFQDLNFNISFADALILMPKFGPTIKSLLTNKEKLFELARTPFE
nr:reverse transcriptase domain-containing protein [Tanacetum cinerariifolium]